MAGIRKHSVFEWKIENIGAGTIGIGVRNWNSELKFGIGIRNWNSELEFGIGIRNLELEFGIGSPDPPTSRVPSSSTSPTPQSKVKP